MRGGSGIGVRYDETRSSSRIVRARPAHRPSPRSDCFSKIFNVLCSHLKPSKTSKIQLRATLKKLTSSHRHHRLVLLSPASGLGFIDSCGLFIGDSLFATNACLAIPVSPYTLDGNREGFCPRERLATHVVNAALRMNALHDRGSHVGYVTSGW